MVNYKALWVYSHRAFCFVFRWIILCS